jgi:hypothetical protein
VRRYPPPLVGGRIPAGVYSVATSQLAATLELHPLESLACIAFWVALGA